MNLLYFKEYKRQDITIKEFLKLFFTKLNPNYNTLFVKNNQIQCSYGKQRSLGDIYRITKYYYPSVTRKKVKNILLSFQDKLVGHWCPDIHKRIYEIKDNKFDWEQLLGPRFDEYREEFYYLDKYGQKYCIESEDIW